MPQSVQGSAAPTGRRAGCRRAAAVHHLHHALVLDVPVGADDDRHRGLAGLGLTLQRLHPLDQVGELDRRGLGIARAVLDLERGVLVDDHLHEAVGLAVGLAHAGQVDLARRQHRRGDHEDDQQHQHDVDERTMLISFLVRRPLPRDEDCGHVSGPFLSAPRNPARGWRRRCG